MSLIHDHASAPHSHATQFGEGLRKRQRRLLSALAAAALGLQAPALLAAPQAVSPASDSGIAIIEARCPTFSWSSVDNSAGYELSVVRSAASDADSDQPVLSVNLPKGATSWTPNIEQCLASGEHTWSVRAIGTEADTGWSAPSRFWVAPEARTPELEEALAVVRQHLLETGALGPVAPSSTLAVSAAAALQAPEVQGGGTNFDVDAAGNVVANAFTGSGSGLTGIPVGALGFDTATQAELNTHKGSGDHDGRYLNLTGAAQNVTSTVTFRNANFGLAGDPVTNLVNFEDSAAFAGNTTPFNTSFLRVQGRYEFGCTVNRNQVRVGDVCMDTFARGPTNDVTDAIAACAQNRMTLCPLNAIMNCDQLNIGNNSPTFETCGTLTDSILSNGKIWTGTTLTDQSGSAFSELLVFEGTGNRTVVGGAAGTTTAHYFCCVSVPGD